MSPARSASTGSGGGGRAAVTALIVVAVAVGMLLLVRSRPKVEAFDPRSSGPNGANGAVLLMEQYGATVDISAQAPSPGTDVRVFVIVDRLNDNQRAALLRFVDAGGIAVVADPASSLQGKGAQASSVPVGDYMVPDSGSQLDAVSESNVALGTCTIGALRDLRGVYSVDGRLFATSATDDSCFAIGGHAFVIARHRGAGLVVGLGDNRIVTNQYLRYGDNASVVTSLLAPDRGARVRVMIGTGVTPSPQDIGSGDETLLDIVRPSVWMALTQLALAFVVFCIARGIRPGRAVREPQPTPIAGSELVLATGNLMQRAHHFERAGWLIRGEFYRQLVAHFRLPPDISIDRLSELAGRRSGVDPRQLFAVLNREVADAGALVVLRADIADLRFRMHIGASSTLPPTPPSTTERTPERV